nr:Crp/Fnr family transcriptional regulator [Hymenobacter arizonensis]
MKTLKSNATDKELITGYYGPGEFFGFLPLLEHTARSDSAVATDESELVHIPKDDFSQLLLRNPAVSQQFIRLLAGRVSEREAQLLAMAYAQAGSDECLHFTRDDLATMVGTAPESLIRTLSEFRPDGLVESSRPKASGCCSPISCAVPAGKARPIVDKLQVLGCTLSYSRLYSPGSFGY